VSACNFCGRENEAGAQFCSDCGKPLTKAAALRTAAAAAGAAGAGGGGSGGGAVVPRTHVLSPPFARTVAEAHPCPVCGSAIDPVAGPSRFTPDRRTDQRLTLVLLDERGTEVQRFERKHAATTIGRLDGDVRFPDDAFLSPLHAKVSWEENGLEVRDLGSRNGTWVFLAAPHRLVDGDLFLIGSQVIRFRRLGYPGPHPPDADSTTRMGSVVPSADIASLTQLRSDGSSRDTIQLSPGRDVHIGRERGDWIFPYDPSMSAQHATVRSEDADFVLLDDHSRNGVAIAARGAMVLEHHSRIMVGDKLLRIELPT
jgi:pSer/pThr/pTyr-binding forkhead associated (FHA) protein